MYTVESIVTNKIKKSWLPFINEEVKKDYFKKTLETINKDNETCKVFPEPKRVLKALTYCEVNEIKLIFLGQDPYIRQRQHKETGELVTEAMGLAFSVPKGINIPPSLKNIYKELKDDKDLKFDKIPNHGSLIRWAKYEKILLLNTALTVKEGKSNSHQKLWIEFTDNLIKYISDNNDKTMFLLLGNNAKKKDKLIKHGKHIVLKGVHPSPLSAQRGFFGSCIFSSVNDNLELQKKKPINWKIN